MQLIVWENRYDSRMKGMGLGLPYVCKGPVLLDIHQDNRYNNVSWPLGTHGPRDFLRDRAGGGGGGFRTFREY